MCVGWEKVRPVKLTICQPWDKWEEARQEVFNTRDDTQYIFFYYDFDIFDFLVDKTDLSEKELIGLQKLFRKNTNKNFSQYEYELNKDEFDEYLKSIGFTLETHEVLDGDYSCFYRECWERQRNR